MTPGSYRVTPAVSVLIPTYNRAEILTTTLQAFTNVDSEGIAWELIVIDNNSRDTTREVVLSFEGHLPIRYLFEPRQGKNWALNSAIEQTKNGLLVFADDDITPCRDWLREIVASVDRWPEHVLFGGRIEPCFPPSTPAFVRQSDFSGYVYAGLDFGPHECVFPEKSTPNGANCWIRRCIFDRGVRYNTSIGPNGRGRISGSELELFTRLRRDGAIPVYIPGASVVHRIEPYQTTLWYLLRRAYASGRGWVRIHGARDSECKTIFRAPRYYYREAAETAIKALIHLCAGKPQRSFEQLMHAAQFLGCIRESTVQRRGMRRPRGPGGDVWRP